MEYLLLAIATLGISLQDLMRKFTNSKYNDPEGAPAAFNFLMTAASLCLFTVLSLIGGFQFHAPTLIYALIFGTGFAVAVYFNYQAVRLGPLSLTSLVIAYSLIIPTLSGILFLSEPFRVTSAVGIGLLLISLLLINGRTDKNGAPITKKWVIAVLLAFLGNGLCSLMPKLHQAAYPGGYRTEFMTFGMVLVTTVFLISFLRQKAARDADSLFFTAGRRRRDCKRRCQPAGAGVGKPASCRADVSYDLPPADCDNLLPLPICVSRAVIQGSAGGIWSGDSFHCSIEPISFLLNKSPTACTQHRSPGFFHWRMGLVFLYNSL